jgi:hypothetical protein
MTGNRFASKRAKARNWRQSCELLKHCNIFQKGRGGIKAQGGEERRSSQARMEVMDAGRKHEDLSTSEDKMSY